MNRRSFVRGAGLAAALPSVSAAALVGASQMESSGMHAEEAIRNERIQAEVMEAHEAEERELEAMRMEREQEGPPNKRDNNSAPTSTAGLRACR